MIYSNAFYANPENTTIRVDISGATSFVPCVPGNSDYAAIQALVASGELIVAPYVAPPAPVPSITRRQLRLWLLGNGKTDADVRTIIGAIPDATQRAAAMIEWEDSNTYHRDHPLVAQLAPGIGLATPEGVDAAFREAATL